MARQPMSCARGVSSREHCRIFAEKILFMIPGVTRVEPRWEDGIFLGVPDRSDELYVGTERGMHKVRTVRRREATERVDLTFLNSVSARPWDGPKKVRDVRVVLLDVSSPAAVAEAEAIGNGRRLYISKADLMRHGLTEGCLGCRCLAEEKRAQGHSEGCRARLEAEIAKTEEGRARLTTAYLRSLPRDEGREPGAGAEAPAAVPAPPRSDEVQDEPMNAREASRKRSAEDAGHEADDGDRWLTTACPSSGGRPSARRRRCGTGGGVFVGESATSLAHSYRVQVWQWICVRDGIWGSEPTRSKPRRS